jgi:hypothetical protein
MIYLSLIFSFLIKKLRGFGPLVIIDLVENEKHDKMWRILSKRLHKIQNFIVNLHLIFMCGAILNFMLVFHLEREVEKQWFTWNQFRVVCLFFSSSKRQALILLYINFRLFLYGIKFGESFMKKQNIFRMFQSKLLGIKFRLKVRK